VDPDVDTLTRTVTDNSFQYIFACNTFNSAGAYSSEVDIENLNLNEPTVVGGSFSSIAPAMKILDMI